ncbi:MAG: MFS transporter [Pedosphaera sp.]|nr:MFS transporter [Pedosphaera sp.]
MNETTDRHSGYDKRRLFLLSVIALTTTGIGFSIRGNIASELQSDLFDPIDKLRSAEMVATALGVVFLGYAFTIAIGSSLLDYIGMGRLLTVSSVLFFIGTFIVVFSRTLQGTLSLYWVVWLGMLIIGIGQGLVETVINPLAATLYPDDKTHKLNVLHAWWPGGIIIGGLIGLALGEMKFNWQVQMAIVLLPAAIFGIMAIGSKFPPTERVAAGVSAGAMMKEVFRPFFILWFLCMFLTAAAELAPGQWVDMALTRTVGMKGIWLLIYVSGLMFVMRHFAGPLAHRLSPVGLLWISCLLASVGLIFLSIANSKITGLLAATVWGVGVCYMWPTMLGAASERFPRGGALLMGLMGTGGTLSIYFVLPQMGKIFDNAKIREAGGEEAFKALSGEKLNAVLTYASQYSFRVVAILPAILLIVFGAIWFFDKARGGYKPVKIADDATLEDQN